MARSEFRFVLDGVELDSQHEEQIARAIQEAGMKAVASIGLQQEFVAIDVGALGRRWEWIGRIALTAEVAEQALPRLHELGIFRQQ